MSSERSMSGRLSGEHVGKSVSRNSRTSRHRGRGHEESAVSSADDGSVGAVSRSGHASPSLNRRKGHVSGRSPKLKRNGSRAKVNGATSPSLVRKASIPTNLAPGSSNLVPGSSPRSSLRDHDRDSQRDGRRSSRRLPSSGRDYSRAHSSSQLSVASSSTPPDLPTSIPPDEPDFLAHAFDGLDINVSRPKPSPEIHELTVQHIYGDSPHSGATVDTEVFGVEPESAHFDVLLEYPEDIGQPISDLRAHVERLGNVVGWFQDQEIDGFDLEYEYLAEVQRQTGYVPDFTSALRVENLEKNRYTNILPPEHTRVVLKDIYNDDASNFVNANYLDGQIEGTERRYISCQGPLEHTAADFWRMVWELDISVVCMLTREIEDSLIKCDRYWPDDDEEEWYMQWFGTPAPCRHALYPYEDALKEENIAMDGSIVDSLVSNGIIYDGGVEDDASSLSTGEPLPATPPPHDQVSGLAESPPVDSSSSSKNGAVVDLGGSAETPANAGSPTTRSAAARRVADATRQPVTELNRIYGDIRVNFVTKRYGDEFIVREFVLQHLFEGSTRRITQLQYVGWPDHGIPSSRDGFLDLVRLSDELNTTKAPILVHCSAGVGRTGTFCTVHSCLEKFRAELRCGVSPTFNLLLCVLNMRVQRLGIVQTKEQFQFAYIALLEQISREMQAS